MKKKQISLILAVLILGLSGCSSKETSEPVQETIEIESTSEIESIEESSVSEEPTESSEPETESEEETIEVETTEEITTEIESVEETTEALTEELSVDGVSESAPVQTVEDVVEPVQSETPVVEVPVSEPVEIQSQEAEIPAEPQPVTPTQSSDGTITVYNAQEGRSLTLTPNWKGWYTDQDGCHRNAQGQKVKPSTGEPYEAPEIRYNTNGVTGGAPVSGSGVSSH